MSRWERLKVSAEAYGIRARGVGRSVVQLMAIVAVAISSWATVYLYQVSATYLIRQDSGRPVPSPFETLPYFRHDALVNIGWMGWFGVTLGLLLIAWQTT